MSTESADEQEWIDVIPIIDTVAVYTSAEKVSNGCLSHSDLTADTKSV